MINVKLLIRAALMFLVISLIIAEGYYIVHLRDRISRQTEELRNISMRLQDLKNEKEDLNRELSAIKKITGDGKSEAAGGR